MTPKTLVLPQPWPSRWVLAWWVVAVLVAHLAMLWGMTGSLDWRMPTDDVVRVTPLQTRWIPPVQVASASVATTTQPHTRIATREKAPPEQVPVPVSEPAPASNGEASVQLPAQAASETSTTAQAPAEATAEAPNNEAMTAPEPTPPTATPPPAVQTTNTAWPSIPVGALPASILLSYKLTGQEKGLNYFANGELRWQHNEAAYALSLSVKAFLVGSRHWRSVGQINETGLAPNRFSDSWRNERAAHFDRTNQRVVFSNNAPIAMLEAGAQDQISLYVQLAAAMAGAPQRFEPGTRLQVQTATIKDALPWLLTLGASENLPLNGQTVATSKWVCQPRNRFDATVEFWVSAQHAWMPVRIRITQVSGSYIDLMLSGYEALPPLPTQATPAPHSSAAAG